MNKEKKIKSILFLSLIVALVLPFSGMDFAEAQKAPKLGDKKIEEKTKDDFKNDLKQWIKDTSDDKKSNEEKATETKTEYDKVLRDLIEQIRIETSTNELSEVEIKSAMEYIFQETVKDEKLKIVNDENTSTTLDVDFLESFGIQTAQAVCPTTVNPVYKQVSIDINGGTYGGFTFGGGNGLTSVTYTDNSSTCTRTYTLTFNDEDHPRADAFYDGIRQNLYHRIADIETFDIKNNNEIIYVRTFSLTDDFDCLRGWAIGCHNSGTQTYTPGDTIYVSNTWNHMMSTSDTNSSLTKVTVP